MNQPFELPIHARIIRFTTVMTILLLSIMLFAQSSSYRIQQGDRLSLSFWEYPEMNAIVTVGRDGNIELPIIGNTAAKGLTIDDLRRSIISKMAIYNRLVNSLTISIQEFGQNVVYVTGHVAKPGKYNFEEIPNLWNIILEAGGPLQGAVLNNIAIVRNDDRGEVITVNLAEALNEGKLLELPEIKPGDTISITGLLPTGESSSSLVNKQEMYIVGAVLKPGLHQFNSKMNLLEALGKAGGPTAKANLKNARYVIVEDGKSRIIKLNLNDYLVDGRLQPLPIMREGSTLYIPEKKGFSPVLATLLTATISAAITSTIVAVVK